MTEEQITAIAREYAEGCIDPQGFSKDTYEEMVEEKAENTAYVLRWLSQRYCLMEKIKLEELDIPRRVKEHRALILDKRELDALFPEIAKEVEDAR